MTTRTAELCSEQENTDLLELMVIVDMVQCQVLQRYKAKGKSLRTCGLILPGAFERSSEPQQLGQEHNILNVQGRNWETETLACQSAVSFS